MKTLAVCFSKTGNTKRVAEAVAKKLNCEIDYLKFDEKANTIESSHNPAEYDRIIILSPIWAFSLSIPMKLYLEKYKSAIKSYSLIVTYSLCGVTGCVKNCKAATGKPPEKTMKFKGKNVQKDLFDISGI